MNQTENRATELAIAFIYKLNVPWLLDSSQPKLEWIPHNLQFYVCIRNGQKTAQQIHVLNLFNRWLLAFKAICYVRVSNVMDLIVQWFAFSDKFGLLVSNYQLQVPKLVYVLLQSVGFKNTTTSWWANVYLCSKYLLLH